MKIIFLDIDGVLNCETTQERWERFVGIDQKLVSRFMNIINQTGAKVVLSSTWRLEDNWREVMAQNGLTCEFIDRTIHLPEQTRGQEIQNWLDNHSGTFEKYAIIDDNTDLLPNQIFFKTSMENGGLTEEISQSVIKYLNA